MPPKAHMQDHQILSKTSGLVNDKDHKAHTISIIIRLLLGGNILFLYSTIWIKMKLWAMHLTEPQTTCGGFANGYRIIIFRNYLQTLRLAGFQFPWTN